MNRFAFAAALVCATPAFADAAYFAAIEDLPLPPGFAERDTGGGFDSREGRLVLAYAEGELSGVAVRDFYYDALPQLGWAVSPGPDGALVFQRGREELSFTFEREGASSRLGVRLVTHPAPTNGN